MTVHARQLARLCRERMATNNGIVADAPEPGAEPGVSRQQEQQREATEAAPTEPEETLR